MIRLKTNRAFCAFVAALMMFATLFANVAFIQTPDKSSKSQLELVSIKAVDVQTSATGIRNYAAVVDTARAYQVNDVITLATTFNVKNIAKNDYKNLGSIKDKDVEVLVGSEDVDLSYSKHSSPVVISDMYSGYNDTAIANIAIPGYSASSTTLGVLDISSIVTYDKQKNEVKFVLRGYESNKTQTVEFKNTSASIKDSKINVPALRAKDGKETMTIGNQDYSLDYTAPSSLNYTVLLTGVTQDNSGKAKGNFYAKIQVRDAEDFQSFNTYYVKNGKVLFEKPTGTEFVDYVKVEVKKLSLKDNYNVYRYEVPASGVTEDTDIVYLGDDSDAKNKVLAKVNPAQYDNNTSQGGTGTDVAGAVKKAKALNGGANEVDVPATGVVYTNDKSYFAPYFYQGITTVSKDQSTISGQITISEVEMLRDTRETSIQQKYVKNFIGKITYDKTLTAAQAINIVRVEITGKNKAGATVKVVHESDTKNLADADAIYSISVSNTKNLVVTITPRNGNEVAAVDWSVQVKADTTLTGTGGTNQNYTLKTEATPDIAEAEMKDYINGFYNKNEMAILEQDADFEVLDKAGKAVAATEYTLTKDTKNGKITGIILVPKQVEVSVTNPTTGAVTKEIQDPAWAKEDFTVRVYHLVPDGGVDSVTPITAEAVLKLNEVVNQNGIVTYAITDADDKPIVSVATESTYFSGEDGFAIALFDNTLNNAERIFRSNNGNLTYASGKGYVSNSATILKALKFFGMDTSFGSTYKVQDDDFTKFSAKSEFGEDVVGSFQYGVIGVVEDLVDEQTIEEDLETEEPIEEPEETEEPELEELDLPPVPKTGDVSSNVGLALVSAAIISSLMLTVVLKKSREGK